MGKIRKCGYTCCACYRFFSLLIKRYGHLKIPAKEQKKTQKNRSHFTSSVKRPLFDQFDRSVNGIVKRVIIKDMSRFGRDYLQVGMYTEIMFLEHDVHFIAVNDGVDSAQGDNEFTPFRNIINE